MSNAVVPSASHVPYKNTSPSKVVGAVKGNHEHWGRLHEILNKLEGNRQSANDAPKQGAQESGFKSWRCSPRRPSSAPTGPPVYEGGELRWPVVMDARRQASPRDISRLQASPRDISRFASVRNRVFTIQQLQLQFLNEVYNNQIPSRPQTATGLWRSLPPSPLPSPRPTTPGALSRSTPEVPEMRRRGSGWQEARARSSNGNHSAQEEQNPLSSRPNTPVVCSPCAEILTIASGSRPGSPNFPQNSFADMQADACSAPTARPHTPPPKLNPTASPRRTPPPSSRPRSSSETQGEQSLQASPENLPALVLTERGPDEVDKGTPSKLPLQVSQKSPTKFRRRPVGPKATLAYAAAARAAAKWQIEMPEAAVIGAMAKQTHFDLTNIPQDAITRADSMESTYRRGYVWTESHAKLNPRTHFSLTNLPTAAA